MVNQVEEDTIKKEISGEELELAKLELSRNPPSPGAKAEILPNLQVISLVRRFLSGLPLTSGNLKELRAMKGLASKIMKTQVLKVKDQGSVSEKKLLQVLVRSLAREGILSGECFDIEPIPKIVIPNLKVDPLKCETFNLKEKGICYIYFLKKKIWAKITSFK